MYSPLDDNWDYCIRQGAPRVSYADFYYPADAEEPTLTDIPIESFSLTVDRRSDIRRTCELSIVSEELLSEIKSTAGSGSGLEPYGGEIRLRHGMIIAETGDEITVPLGCFHIETMSYENPGARMTFSLVDRSMVLKRKLYGFPRNAAGLSSLAVINTPIAYHFPYAAQVFDGDVYDVIIPGGVTHRGDVLTIVQETASSLGAECYFDQTGQARLSLVPVLDSSFSGAPDWEIDCGVEGVMVKASHSVSRTDTYNRVLVIGVNPSETEAAVYADVEDVDPASPTYYQGPFGQHDLWIDDNTLTTYEMCLTRANAELANNKGLSRTVSLTSLSNPALDAGDIIRATYIDDTRAFHLVDSYTMDHTGQMQIETRTERED